MPLCSLHPADAARDVAPRHAGALGASPFPLLIRARWFLSLVSTPTLATVNLGYVRQTAIRLSLGARTSELIQAHFGKFGELDKVCLITDRRTGLSKCFAFIYFMNLEDAVKACVGLVNSLPL